MKRVFLAGLLGGVVMFAWMTLAHVVFPLGQVGVQEIPNEAPVLAAMQASLGQNPGFYFFPGMGLGPNATKEQERAGMQDYQKKLDANPSGILVYSPPGMKGFTGRQLGTEALTEFLEALLAAWLLSQTRISGYLGRVGFVLVAGIIAAMATNVPYWNWYHFPTNYTEAYAGTQVIGYLCAGLVAAAIVKPRE